MSVDKTEYLAIRNFMRIRKHKFVKHFEESTGFKEGDEVRWCGETFYGKIVITVTVKGSTNDLLDGSPNVMFENRVELHREENGMTLVQRIWSPYSGLTPLKE